MENCGLSLKINTLAMREDSFLMAVFSLFDATWGITFDFFVAFFVDVVGTFFILTVIGLGNLKI
jgi:hypothetical protein